MHWIGWFSLLERNFDNLSARDMSFSGLYWAVQSYFCSHRSIHCNLEVLHECIMLNYFELFFVFVYCCMPACVYVWNFSRSKQMERHFLSMLTYPDSVSVRDFLTKAMGHLSCMMAVP